MEKKCVGCVSFLCYTPFIVAHGILLISVAMDLSFSDTHRGLCMPTHTVSPLLLLLALILSLMSHVHTFKCMLPDKWQQCPINNKTFSKRSNSNAGNCA